MPLYPWLADAAVRPRPLSGQARLSATRRALRRRRDLRIPIARIASPIACTAARMSDGPDRADAADAERLELRQLARVQDEAAVAHLGVEALELVRRVGRRVERVR